MSDTYKDLQLQARPVAARRYTTDLFETVTAAPRPDRVKTLLHGCVVVQCAFIELQATDNFSVGRGKLKDRRQTMTRSAPTRGVHFRIPIDLLSCVEVSFDKGPPWKSCRCASFRRRYTGPPMTNRQGVSSRSSNVARAAGLVAVRGRHAGLPRRLERTDPHRVATLRCWPGHRSVRRRPSDGAQQAEKLAEPVAHLDTSWLVHRR